MVQTKLNVPGKSCNSAVTLNIYRELLYDIDLNLVDLYCVVLMTSVEVGVATNFLLRPPCPS